MGHHLPARVIGQLKPGVLRVIVGVGIGLMDGGVETNIPIENVPEDLRTPNSEFSVVIHSGRLIEVRRKPLA